MARLIKCPRCQSQIDVTNVAGGGTVRCPDCGAMVRIPTGSTGQYQKVQAAVPQAAAAAPQRETRSRPAGSGRGTSLFKKMSGARQPGGSRPPSRSSAEAEGRRGATSLRGRGSNTGLIAAGAGGGMVLLIVVLILAMNSKAGQQKKADEDRAAKNAEIREINRKNAEETRRKNAEMEAQEKADAEAAAKGAKPDMKLQKVGGKYVPPATFEPGAMKFIQGQLVDLGATDALTKEYEAMASAGRVNDIVNDEKKWAAYLLNGMLNDSEPIARSSFQAMRSICDKLKVSTEGGGSHPVNIELFNSAQWRGGQYQQWVAWIPKNIMARGAEPGAAPGAAPQFAAENPDKVNWDDIMKDLRAGGALDKVDRPEGRAYARVQAMGKSAYPKLIGYIGHEELPLAKAAVTVLNSLTGRQGTIPNATNKDQIKSEWEAWYSKEGK